MAPGGAGQPAVLADYLVLPPRRQWTTWFLVDGLPGGVTGTAD